MRTSMLLGMFEWVGELVMNMFNFIPKIVYLFYASLASVLDILQLFFRKLAGLDVYYQEVGGKLQTVSGDLVTNFITGILGIGGGQRYPALTTVFWSLVIFGVIVCIGSVFIAVIKSHYNYDDKAAKGGPMQYVYTGIKALVNMAAVPIIIVLGLWVSQALLTALDQITSTTNGALEGVYGTVEVIGEDGKLYKTSALNHYCESTYTSKNPNGTGNDSTKSYIYYDIFGFSGSIRYNNEDFSVDDGSQFWVMDSQNYAKVAAANQTFSGALFKAASYNANRVRLGQLTLDNTSGMDTIFSRARQAGQQEGPDLLAQMVDEAFANHLHLKEWMFMDYRYANPGIFSKTYFTTYNTYFIKAFSKFNVGAVWYYYDLWQFNFIVGFGAIIVCVALFLNIIFGLMTRLFMAVGLFLVAPPIFGLEPLDGGNGKKAWIKQFVQQVLMVYGSVVGMNIFFLIFPYINEIKFFNIAVADYFVTALFIIVGLITIKSFIHVLGELVGGADAVEAGDKISKEVGSTMGKATSMALAPAKLAFKGGRNFVNWRIEKAARKKDRDAERELGQANLALEVANASGDSAAIDRARERVASAEHRKARTENKLATRTAAHSKSKKNLKDSAKGLFKATTTPFKSLNFVNEFTEATGITDSKKPEKEMRSHIASLAKSQETRDDEEAAFRRAHNDQSSRDYHFAQQQQIVNNSATTAQSSAQTATNIGEANRLLATGNTQRRDIANNTRATADHTLRANQELVRGNAQRGRIETNTANTATNTAENVAETRRVHNAINYQGLRGRRATEQVGATVEDQAQRTRNTVNYQGRSNRKATENVGAEVKTTRAAVNRKANEIKTEIRNK